MNPNIEWRNIVYGPVKSRRLGQSLGINLTPLELKVCNFSCGYCRVGVPSKGYAEQEDFEKYGLTLENVKEAISDGLEHYAKNQINIDYVTIAGNGEPTLYPWLEEIVEHLLLGRDRILPEKPTAVFTNATKVNQENVRRAIYKLDRRFFKLDAGDEKTFRRINVPIGVTYDEVIKNLLALDDYELSIAVTSGDVSNYNSFFNPEFIEALRKMKFTRVFVYDIDIPKTVSPRFNRKTEKERLDELAEHLRKKTSKDVVVLWEPTTRHGNIPLYPPQIN